MMRLKTMVLIAKSKNCLSQKKSKNRLSQEKSENLLIPKLDRVEKLIYIKNLKEYNFLTLNTRLAFI